MDAAEALEGLKKALESGEYDRGVEVYTNEMVAGLGLLVSHLENVEHERDRYLGALLDIADILASMIRLVEGRTT